MSDDLDEPFKWVFPDITIEGKDFLVVLASGKDIIDSDILHTNFKLDKNGEHLLLTTATGEEIDSLKIPELEENISFGRKPD